MTQTLEASSDESDGGGAWGSHLKHGGKAKRGTPQGTCAAGGTAGGGVAGGAVGSAAVTARPVLLEALSDSDDDGGVGFGTELTGTKAEAGPKAPVGVCARPVMRWEDEALCGSSEPSDATSGAVPAIVGCEHGHAAWSQRDGLRTKTGRVHRRE
jgi:hypothetical protein